MAIAWPYGEANTPARLAGRVALLDDARLAALKVYKLTLGGAQTESRARCSAGGAAGQLVDGYRAGIAVLADQGSCYRAPRNQASVRTTTQSLYPIGPASAGRVGRDVPVIPCFSLFRFPVVDVRKASFPM